MDLIFGTAQLNGSYGRFRSTQSANACKLLQSARESGFGALDTASAYEGVEETIGRCGWAGKIHTKLGDLGNARKALDESLRRLQRPSVDMIYLHDPAVLRQPNGFFTRLRVDLSKKKAENLGISVYTLEELERACLVPEIDVIQIPLSLADGRITDGSLIEAKKRGKKVFARSVFLQGALLKPSHELPQDLERLRPFNSLVRQFANASNRSVLEVLLGWVRSRTAIDGVILGAETSAQVLQLSEVFRSVVLNEAEIETLKGLQLKDPEVLDPRRWTNFERT